MISVCVATYNGEKYIVDQLNSILEQLSPEDEVVVCDDRSADNTVKVIRSLQDHRIKIFVNEINVGYIKNFEKALMKASGDYIFLADQDDVWPKGRVRLMIDAAEKHKKSVVVGNIETFTDQSQVRHKFPTRLREKHNRYGLYNVINMLKGGVPYFGCCMLLKNSYLNKVLPFRFSEVSHDIWIAISANCDNDIYHLSDVVIYRRLHEKNLTKRRKLVERVKTRVRWLNIIFYCFFKKLRL